MVPAHCMSITQAKNDFQGGKLKKILSESTSKKGGKDQEWIQSSITPDPGYHM